MNRTILVTALLAALAVATLGWLRRRAGRRRIEPLGNAGELSRDISRRELMRSISGLCLTQVGHSRRIEDDVVCTDRIVLFSYTCETGLEHERRSHRWRVAMCRLDCECSRAIVTAQPWLKAASWRPALAHIPINGVPGDGGLVALAEDGEEWHRRLDAGLGHWLARGETQRSWEVGHGIVVAYEAGRFDGSAQKGLRDAVAEFCSMLKVD